jgi:hypothetical protein
MLYDAFEAARETYAKDPGLELPENITLKEKLSIDRITEE